tara:strand:+ start:2208 stop:3464 length:1257 start_codon:yes stop_codon:yes gene_type:complete
MSVDLNSTPLFFSELKETILPLSENEKKNSISFLNENKLPTTRNEAWKYTRLAKLGKSKFISSNSELESIDQYNIDPSATTLVFVNGFFSEELSSNDCPNNLTWSLLSQKNKIEETISDESEYFNCLNSAFLVEGVELNIADKAIMKNPIQIIHVLNGDAIISNFRIVVNAGKSSEASIITGFFSENGDSQFSNVISEINVAENAKLTMDKIQYETESTFHISTEKVKQARNSVFTINTATLNGGLVRNNVVVDVDGENCNTHMNGAYLLKNKQHVDNHTLVNHNVPNCDSFELYKGVMDDKSTAVFNGKVIVHKDAQKINAFQSNGNVLISDDATVNSKPELEIFADDVKCSHGSTTGQLDDEAIFYLQCRGLSKKSAHQLMVSAFIGEVLEKFENENVRTYINGLLKSRFNWDYVS